MKSTLPVSEPNAISKFRSWKAGELDKIEKREKSLLVRIKAAVPDNLKALFEYRVPLASSLISHGWAKREYSPDDAQILGFTDLEKLKTALLSLEVSFENIISVQIYWKPDFKEVLILELTAL